MFPCSLGLAPSMQSYHVRCVLSPPSYRSQVSVNMPSIEVGTVGGGTSLPAQAACLDVVGCRGATQAPGRPGENAQQMAKCVFFFFCKTR